MIWAYIGTILGAILAYFIAYYVLYRVRANRRQHIRCTTVSATEITAALRAIEKDVAKQYHGELAVVAPLLQKADREPSGKGFRIPTDFKRRNK